LHLVFGWHRSASAQPPTGSFSQPVARNIGKKRFDVIIETIHQSFHRITDTAEPAEEVDLPSGSLKAHGAAALQAVNGFGFHLFLFREHSFYCQWLLPLERSAENFAMADKMQ
jgi:hypothetical protein